VIFTLISVSRANGDLFSRDGLLSPIADLL